jgi:V/A-type H+-transporting ATPase subunit E
MAETIETFITKLRTEGIQQGKQEAQQIKEEARKEADILLAEAKAQADKIIADANSEAKGILSRGSTELELASRDAVLKLRESLEQALQSVLLGPVEKNLNDDTFLKELIKSIMDRFLSAAMDSYTPVKINVSAEIHKKLVDWAINELRSRYQDHTGGFDLNNNLRQAGFEFTVHGATVEVTRDSVLETLMNLVGPHLREVLSSSMGDK